MENIVEFEVLGEYALFSDPLTRMGGEKSTYQIPTYEAMKGILSSVYWKPTIIWIIDQVRVMNLIRTQTRSAKPVNFSGGNSLSIYTYLVDVRYQVRAHFIWNLNRPDLEQDRNENKHYFVAKRMIEHGGRRDIFLGTRECQGYVLPHRFGEGQSAYGGSGNIDFGLMFHGFDYPDEFGKDVFRARFWRPLMTDGVITFPLPEQCTISREIRKMKATPPLTCGLDEGNLLEEFPQGGKS